MGVPPGSLVCMTSWFLARRVSASFWIWVLFPLPSMPSKVMNILVFWVDSEAAVGVFSDAHAVEAVVVDDGVLDMSEDVWAWGEFDNAVFFLNVDAGFFGFSNGFGFEGFVVFGDIEVSAEKLGELVMTWYFLL